MSIIIRGNSIIISSSSSRRSSSSSSTRPMVWMTHHPAVIPAQKVPYD